MRCANGFSMLVLVVARSGCACVQPPQTTYLETTENPAAQEEVRKRLGPPVTSGFKDGGPD